MRVLTSVEQVSDSRASFILISPDEDLYLDITVACE